MPAIIARRNAIRTWRSDHPGAVAPSGFAPASAALPGTNGFQFAPVIAWLLAVVAVGLVLLFRDAVARVLVVLIAMIVRLFGGVMWLRRAAIRRRRRRQRSNEFSDSTGSAGSTAAGPSTTTFRSESAELTGRTVRVPFNILNWTGAVRLRIVQTQSLGMGGRRFDAREGRNYFMAFCVAARGHDAHQAVRSRDCRSRVLSRIGVPGAPGFREFPRAASTGRVRRVMTGRRIATGP